MNIEAIKEVLAWVMNKYFQFSNNVMTFVPLSYQRIKPFKLYMYNYIVYTAMWSLVTVMHTCGIQLFCVTVE